MLFLSSADLFLNQLFQKILSVSSGLAPDQDPHFVRPDLGPNSVQWLSADKKKVTAVKERVNTTYDS